ncbi:hypothetical protein HY837_04960 [archaeon]|nr:hypothetical protein [archaeon]
MISMVFGWFKSKNDVEILIDSLDSVLKKKLNLLEDYLRKNLFEEDFKKRFRELLIVCSGLISQLENLKEPFLRKFTDEMRICLTVQRESLDKGSLERGLLNEKEIISVNTFLKNLSFQKAQIQQTGAFNYFDSDEIIKFFEFIELLINLTIKNNIKIIYSVDRSSRILGVLFHSVMSNLGLAKSIKFYFIHGTQEGETTIYSEKQKKELKGKNVLVIDEYAHKKTTINSVCSYLEQFTDTGKVFPAVFSSEASGLNSVTRKAPSWFFKKEYSGVKEREYPMGGVEIDEAAKEIATNVRNSLRALAKIIAEYLKSNRY